MTTSTQYSSADIRDTLMAMRDERRAVELMRFFKTGPGDYGEGDRFLGLGNPKVRLVVREAWKGASLRTASELAKDEWHEVRLCGLLILANHFATAKKQRDEVAMRAIFDLYTSLHPHINNWDLVDLSCTKITGEWELSHPEELLMDSWIKPDKTLWQRRVAMVSTWTLSRSGAFGKALSRARQLVDCRDNLLHKAAGWMLREVGKRGGMPDLRAFLDENARRMPAVMLSYATEKMPPQERAHWQAQRREGIRP